VSLLLLLLRMGGVSRVAGVEMMSWERDIVIGDRLKGRAKRGAPALELARVLVMEEESRNG
jgi:hypothetical protein